MNKAERIINAVLEQINVVNRDDLELDNYKEVEERKNILKY